MKRTPIALQATIILAVMTYISSKGVADCSTLSLPSPQPLREADRYFGHIKAENDVSIEAIKSCLRILSSKMCGEVGREWNTLPACRDAGSKILHLAYGETHRKEIPDLVVFLERDDQTDKLKRHRPTLLWNQMNTPFVRGVDLIRILVFSEDKFDIKSELVRIKNYPENPFAGILATLGLGLSDQDGASEKPEDPQDITWSNITRSHEDQDLFLGQAQLKVDFNSINHVRVQFKKMEKESAEAGDRKQGHDQDQEHPPPRDNEVKSPIGTDIKLVNKNEFSAISAYFSNSRNAFASFGIAMGFTLNTEGTSLGTTGDYFDLNAFAIGKIYLKRPVLKATVEDAEGFSPRYRNSYALVAGTNVAGEKFTELFLGFSFGHLVDKVGALVGLSYIPSRAATAELPRVESTWRPILALEYSF